MDKAKTTAGWDEKHSSLGIWCVWNYRFDGITRYPAKRRIRQKVMGFVTYLCFIVEYNLFIHDVYMWYQAEII